MIAYTSLVLASGSVPQDEFWPLLGTYVHSLASLTLVVGAIALFAQCGFLRIQTGELPSPTLIARDFLLERWHRDRLLSVAAPPLATAMALASFNSFKQLILPSAGFGLDPLLAEWDRALFLGVDPWIITHQLFGSQTATRLIDGFYHGWFVPMTLGVAVCAFLADAELRIQYMLTYIGSWVVTGTVLAYFLPSAGPCFVELAGSPESFAPLMDILRGHDAALIANGDAGLSALRNQQALLAHFGTGHLAMGGGISAMPSMHNALAVLFALGGMRLSRTLGWVMWVYALLIWLGSIHLGWHYAVDGLAAAVVTIGLWAASGRYARQLLVPAVPVRRLGLAVK